MAVLGPHTEVMMLNGENPLPVKVNGEDIPITEVFTYLRSTRNRLTKDRDAFKMLNIVWKSS